MVESPCDITRGRACVPVQSGNSLLGALASAPQEFWGGRGGGGGGKGGGL